MLVENPAFYEAGVSRMAVPPMPVWSPSSFEELLASSATSELFNFDGDNDQAANEGFYFCGHDGQATVQPCRATAADSTVQHCFADMSMQLLDESTCGAVHGDGLAADAWEGKAGEEGMTHRHASGAAATAIPVGAQNIVKGQWSAHEDTLLLKLVEQYGTQMWSKIAKHIAGRVGKQCRERWHNHLRPDIKDNLSVDLIRDNWGIRNRWQDLPDKDTWTEKEERILVEAHLELGNKWSTIAKCIPGRSENMIKNHWNSTFRRLKAKRRNKKKAELGPRLTILADYIRSKMAFIDAASSPALVPNALTPPNQLELALGGPTNRSTVSSSFDTLASSQLENYPNIAPPHLDLSSHYFPQDALCSSTCSYPLDLPSYPDSNYLQPLGCTPDPSGIYYGLYCPYTEYYHEHDGSLDKAFAHIDQGEERKPCAGFGLCEEAKVDLAPGCCAHSGPSDADVGITDLVEMVSQ